MKYIIITILSVISISVFAQEDTFRSKKDANLDWLNKNGIIFNSFTQET